MKGAVKPLAIGIVILVAGELILFWQYQRLEAKRLPAVEQKIERQQQELERARAENALKEFLALRIDGKEGKAKLFLTEQAEVQMRQAGLKLTDNFTDYEIELLGVMEEGRVRFQVAMVGADGLQKQLELITVQKNGGEYYIDELRLAG
ncbi:MAG: hypothetical protein A2748_03785 [Candidatus Wildermuthbacteria bacterium RIFCSPHIGHO2_01_FULL_45_20]|uniref:DUF4878 domain-containing protein n=1 Tax=Candidatus Wildermuthbacteria bacterium RIFCSPHIGHO2_02_FULL_45_25 TaxID=1802450 RepID=A0A1G2R2T3_9BACT|nr:MAG: hypothetical protein A2748_03785 [Candidatus Wildermuthbacteria bacterium RIFCSPHIGHO2_01_FULL_45_20]OHA66562.1 MAG: hypothetical protein A3C04_03960 [Candidatus Wildermuthbacteria bacterium RIFCSPHIGHO2_02_FULL_45_25]